MNKSQVIETFNKHFIEFITDIEKVFPNDTDILAMRKSFNKSLMFSPKTFIRLFNDYFVKFYSNEIEAGDLTFFIENNYREKYGYKETDNVWFINKIDVLREPVRKMTDDDKLKVVQYLKNLKKLTDMYINLKNNS